MAPTGLSHGWRRRVQQPPREASPAGYLTSVAALERCPDARRADRALHNRLLRTAVDPVQIASSGIRANAPRARLESFAHACSRFGRVPPSGLHRSVHRSGAADDCSSSQYVIVSAMDRPDVDAIPAATTVRQGQRPQAGRACHEGTRLAVPRICAVGSRPTLNRERIAAYARSGAHPPAVVCDASFVNGLTAIRSLGRMGVPVFAVDHRPSALGFRSRYAFAVPSPDPGTDAAAYIDLLTELGDVIGRRRRSCLRTIRR